MSESVSQERVRIGVSLPKEPPVRKYEYQSPYVGGKKIWLEFPNGQKVVVSPQARDVLHWWNVDEELFIRRIRELIQGSFQNLKTDDRGFVFSVENLTVSKATMPYEREMLEPDEEMPHIRIDIYGFTGRKMP